MHTRFESTFLMSSARAGGGGGHDGGEREHREDQSACRHAAELTGRACGSEAVPAGADDGVHPPPPGCQLAALRRTDLQAAYGVVGHAFRAQQIGCAGRFWCLSGGQLGDGAAVVVGRAGSSRSAVRACGGRARRVPLYGYAPSSANTVRAMLAAAPVPVT